MRAAARQEAELNTLTRSELNRRVLGRRVMGGAGLLLIADLLLVPWHHFHFDPKRFGLSAPAITLDRTAVQAPKELLGFLAVALAALTLIAPAVLNRASASAPDALAAPRRERILTAGGLAVIAVIFVKLLAEPHFLGIGAWAAVVLGAGLAYGSFLAGQPRVAGNDGADGGDAGLRRGERQWLAMVGAVALVALAVAWLHESSIERLPFPGRGISLPSNLPSGAATTTPSGDGTPDGGAAAPAAGSEGGGPTTVASDGAAPGGRQTIVTPTSGHTLTLLTAHAAGATPATSYVLKMAESAAACRHGTQIGGPVVADDNGQIPDIPALVPPVSPGAYFVCFAQSSNPDVSTPAAPFTVT